MSFFTFTSPLGAVKPRVWSDQNNLYARTSLVWQFLSLFSYSKWVTVDKFLQQVRIDRRLFWIFRSTKTFPFGRVSYVGTEYRSMGTSWGFTDEGVGRHDEMERFTVFLMLKDPDERVNLFSFRGEGAVQTGFEGVLWGGDSMIDSRGDQLEASGRYEKVLSQYLGVPVGHPKSEKTGELRIVYKCVSCGRAVGPTSHKCPWCGAAEKRMEQTRQ